MDSHVFPGYRIPAVYDSPLAKVIVRAPERAAALTRMRCAHGELRLARPRVATTAAFLSRMLDDPTFRAARHNTSLVEGLTVNEGKLT